jgi:hypothetical protein
MESSQNVVIRNLNRAHENSSDLPDQLELDPCRVSLSFATLKFVSSFLDYIIHSPGNFKQENEHPKTDCHKPKKTMKLKNCKELQMSANLKHMGHYTPKTKLGFGWFCMSHAIGNAHFGSSADLSHLYNTFSWDHF